MTWSEFKEAIREEMPASSRFRAYKDDGSSRFVFRGQANSDWKLQTTLERAGHPNLALGRYMQNCGSARRFLGNIVPCEVKFDEDASVAYRDIQRRFPNYEYAGYLRHHGFPSPLLDWTESPFVAAFFAFRNVDKDAESVRIYGYQSDTGHGKGSEHGVAQLELLGPIASIHERHVTQQCWYTWCFREEQERVIICPHEDGFAASRKGTTTDQDVIQYWDILSTERDTVLADLFQMNITPFSLFRTIDSAAETAALKFL